MADHVPIALVRQWIDDAETDTDRFYEDHRDPPTVGNVTFRFADFLLRNVDRFADEAQDGHSAEEVDRG